MIASPKLHEQAENKDRSSMNEYKGRKRKLCVLANSLIDPQKQQTSKGYRQQKTGIYQRCTQKTPNTFLGVETELLQVLEGKAPTFKEKQLFVTTTPPVGLDLWNPPDSLTTIQIVTLAPQLRCTQCGKQRRLGHDFFPSTVTALEAWTCAQFQDLSCCVPNDSWNDVLYYLLTTPLTKHTMETHDHAVNTEGFPIYDAETGQVAQIIKDFDDFVRETGPILSDLHLIQPTQTQNDTDDSNERSQSPTRPGRKSTIIDSKSKYQHGTTSRRALRSQNTELQSITYFYRGMDWDALNACWVPKQRGAYPTSQVNQTRKGTARDYTTFDDELVDDSDPKSRGEKETCRHGALSTKSNVITTRDPSTSTGRKDSITEPQFRNGAKSTHGKHSTHSSTDEEDATELKHTDPNWPWIGIPSDEQIGTNASHSKRKDSHSRDIMSDSSSVEILSDASSDPCIMTVPYPLSRTAGASTGPICNNPLPNNQVGNTTWNGINIWNMADEVSRTIPLDHLQRLDFTVINNNINEMIYGGYGMHDRTVYDAYPLERTSMMIATSQSEVDHVIDEPFVSTASYDISLPCASTRSPTVVTAMLKSTSDDDSWGVFADAPEDEV